MQLTSKLRSTNGLCYDGLVKYRSEVTKEYAEQCLEELWEYIDSTPVPIFKEFCLSKGLDPHVAPQYPGWKQAIEALNHKKESDIERGMLPGDYVPSAAIFSLKQLGWTDKTWAQVDTNLNIQVKYVDSEPDAQ